MLFSRSLSRSGCAALAVWALHAAVSAQALPPEVDAALARAKAKRESQQG